MRRLRLSRVERLAESYDEAEAGRIEIEEQLKRGIKPDIYDYARLREIQKITRKLTPEQEMEAYATYLEGRTNITTIAEGYGMSVSGMHQIFKRLKKENNEGN